MTQMTRRTAVGALLAISGRAAFAGAPEVSMRPLLRPENAAVRATTSELIAGARLGGKIGFVVANAVTGELLEAHNPLLALPPASVTKSLTAQYALEALGPTHRFHTRLIATGAITNGRLDGDLLLVGGGDPHLDTNDLAEMVEALKAAGLRRVNGRFLVSSGGLPHVGRIDPEQPEYLSYNPAVSGLNLNFNRVHFEWKKEGESWDVRMDARTELFHPEVTVAQMEVVERRYPVYTYANGGSTERWTVSEAALGKGGSRWLPVRQPELYAGEVFQSLARLQGIFLPRASVTVEGVSGRVIVDRPSRPLAQVLKAMLRHSTNLTAEVAGLSASRALGYAPRDLASSAQHMNEWMRGRLRLRHPRFVDHSGLSDKSRISASDMVAALLRIGPESTLASILKPMRIRDDLGNLASGSGLRLRAKTGTLNFVSALAGFLERDGTDPLAFAIFASDLPRRAAIPIDDRERPKGAKGWNTQAVRLKWQLLNLWADSHLS
ncbi:MAG TPA: D-alanyl-D-alanine carboxypeptidase/D-alanyl-D-alanine-endopeptidase [Rhodobacteraceae bacterium]|nr:D-alanyl-D-alanine carboxypeptidase/D-alanyl-D-alanine-endopeptidase [Paracoccaceae bacterium]